jgi:ferredoxin--NADP+ reductase
VTLHVAIVGSGPAGCYAAEKLARDAPGAAIDVIDKLPTPYGLIRGGVAPDHQGTKAVAHLFERLFAKGQLAFIGNVQVGRDVSLDALRGLYDAVVIATGAPADRRLGISGEDAGNVFTSGDFVAWYNSQPDREAIPRLDHVRSVVIVGNGNVALDVARLLAKTPEERAKSDCAPDVEAALAAMPLEAIHLVGRRGPAEAAFTAVELHEFAGLVRARCAFEDTLSDETGPNAAGLAELRALAGQPAGKPVAVHFHFLARLELLGDGRAVFRRLRRAGSGFADTADRLELPADLVVTCIGSALGETHGLAVANGVIANDGGKVADGLYVVGWAKRGPTGTIPLSRAESHAVAQRLLAEVTPAGKPGGGALRALLTERAVALVDHAAWRRIDAAEKARAAAPRVRHKFATTVELLAAARGT